MSIPTYWIYPPSLRYCRWPPTGSAPGTGVPAWHTIECIKPISLGVQVCRPFSFVILQSLYDYISHFMRMDSPTPTLPEDSSSSTTSTIYRTSLHRSGQFRVVSISPGQWKDPIQCRLNLRKFQEPYKGGTYRALSYVWGSPSTKETIYVNELPVNVTLNLFCALRYLRQLDRVLIPWVDALVSL